LKWMGVGSETTSDGKEEFTKLSSTQELSLEEHSLKGIWLMKVRLGRPCLKVTHISTTVPLLTIEPFKVIFFKA